MKWMGRGAACLLIFMLGLSLVSALADDAGVLTESELGKWVSQTLLETKALEPLNAPVGEEAHTEEGYAFLYPFATLYYDKPVLDIGSILQGFAITDEAVVTPRGIHIGSPVEALLGAYGWQNPDLYGDGSFAALYQLSQLPEGAYWCWAQLSEGGGLSVQCAVHALSGGRGMYTDAGVVYQVEGGIVTAIRVYGLSQLVTLEEVNSNLRAVTAVQAAGSGDEVEDEAAITEGSFIKSEAPAFGRDDLRFAGIDFLSLTQADAILAFGNPEGENSVQDDTGEWLHAATYGGVTLTFAFDQNQQNARLESFDISGAGAQGPRGILIGDSLESVLMRFQSDGTGETFGGEAILYGNGQTAPCGAMARSGSAATLRYVTSAQDESGTVREVTLLLSFSEDRLAEILLHSW